jgi:hypothetical protein
MACIPLDPLLQPITSEWYLCVCVCVFEAKTGLLLALPKNTLPFFLKTLS